MEEIPDAAKIGALFALIGVGFVSRYAYRSQFDFEKEEQGIVILWAIFWSVILNALFAIFGWKLPPSLLEAAKRVPSGSINLVLALNLAWAWLIGFVYGRLVRSWQIVNRLRVQYAIRGPRLLAWLLWKAFAPQVRLHNSLVHEFLADYAYRHWVIVELEDHKAYYGYLSRFDLAPNKIGDYHLLLMEPTEADLVAGADKGVKLCEFMLLHAAKIRSIRLMTRREQGGSIATSPTLVGRTVNFLLSPPSQRSNRKQGVWAFLLGELS